MKRTVLLTLALTCALAGTPSAHAQSTPGTTASPAPSARSAGGEITKDGLIGRDAFSQDQTLMGPVERVATASDGRVQAIFIRTGGFLGFGARLVSVPEGKFQMRGQNVQLQLTSEEVQKLPEIKDGT